MQYSLTSRTPLFLDVFRERALALISDLSDWLAHLEQAHPKAIELGLERVARVRDAMGLRPAFPVILVGGTNGKGSTCAYLEAILRAQGYTTGLYTSPHLLRYNERVRIDGHEAADADIVRAFERIESARGDVSLTYFEFGTLGAMAQFIEAGVDVAILEVGLGGRLDAVNIFEPVVSLITSIDLDHQAYLGDTRELIGFEKAGIYRARRQAVCADPAPPHTLLDHAQAIGAALQCLGRDFDYHVTDNTWTFQHASQRIEHLPMPAMQGRYQLRNAAGALAGLRAIDSVLPVSAEAIRAGLAQARVPGRFQKLSAQPEIRLDVAHNPEAARALAATLREHPVPGRTLAVFGLLADKDMAGVIDALADAFDAWWVTTSDSPRACPAEIVAEQLALRVNRERIQVCEPVVEALAAARGAARESDRIVVFGSFTTVAAVLDHAARPT